MKGVLLMLILLSLVSSSGHNYKGFSNGNENAIVVDINGLRSVEINDDIVRLGTGFNVRQANDILREHDLVVPFGTCPTVGIAGLTLGGGIGMSSRFFGLTCDSVIGLEIVTADDIFTVNSTNFSHLFGACRGAGNGNFGVITSFTFEAHTMIDDDIVAPVCIYQYQWTIPASSSRRSLLHNISDTWFDLFYEAPKELTMFMVYGRPNVSTLDLGLNVQRQYFGSRSKLALLLERFDKLLPSKVFVHQTTYTNATNYWLRDGASTASFKATSLYIDKKFTNEALMIIEKYITRHTLSDNCVIIDAYGGRIAEIDQNSSAFCHRSAIASIQILAYWLTSNETQRALQFEWSENFYKELMSQRVDNGEAYVNYPNTLWLQNWFTAYNGNHTTKLSEIKPKYDVNNLFSYAQSVPLSTT